MRLYEEKPSSYNLSVGMVNPLILSKGVARVPVQERSIYLDSVTMDYPGIRALDGVTFGVSRGVVHGFLGPNGAGKTTAINIISGLLTPTGGEVELLGDRSRRERSFHVGLLPENPPLYPNTTVKEYLNFVAELYLTPEKRAMKVEQVVQQCRLEQVIGRLIRNLSKGYKQRVGIAQALIPGAPILILDEPTVGLDPNSIQEIRELILSLKGESTIFISSHNLSEIQKLCDEVTIIDQGKVLRSGPMEELSKGLDTVRSFEAKITLWSDEIEKIFQEKFIGHKLEVEEIEGGQFLLSVSTRGEDPREGLSRFLVENGCGLMEMGEKELELEDVFKSLVRGQNE